jgi:predicted transcriptional regulator
MLKRYLRGTHNLKPDQCRIKWGLPRDYPMVAPNYSAKRSALAKKIGLGRIKAGAPSKRRKRG